MHPHNPKSNAKLQHQVQQRRVQRLVQQLRVQHQVQPDRAQPQQVFVEIMQRATSEVDFAHVTPDSPEIHMQLVGPIASLLPISSGAMVFPMVNSRLHVTIGVEVALRGKLRYNAAGDPENTFNYDGDHTYNSSSDCLFRPTSLELRMVSEH
jgi:hypothetical protein